MEYTRQELKEYYDAYRLNCLELGIDELSFDDWRETIDEEQLFPDVDDDNGVDDYDDEDYFGLFGEDEEG